MIKPAGHDPWKIKGQIPSGPLIWLNLILFLREAKRILTWAIGPTELSRIISPPPPVN